MKLSPVLSLRIGAGHLLVCRRCETLLDALRHLGIRRRRVPGVVRRQPHKCAGFRCAWCGPGGRHGMALMCEHANEAPLVCPCVPGCYCTTRTCARLHRREAPPR